MDDLDAGERMRVMVYLYSYPPNRYTGGELMTADLLEHLVTLGHVVDVFSDHLYANETYMRNGVKVQSAGYIHHTMAMTYDVFITHPEIRTGAIKHTAELPYIGIVHNTAPNTMRSLERQPPNLTVVNSEDTRQHVPMAAERSTHGVVVINPPVLIERESIERGGGMPSRHYVTVVNLSHEKGGRVLKYVADNHPDVPFLGVIGGHGRQETEQPPNVTIIPSQDDMHIVYDATKVLLFPTKRESYGKVAAEAMQWGIPCIVGDMPALHEVCDYAAMYVDPADYMEWAHALRRMMKSEDELALWCGRSAERGRALRAKSIADLDRWAALVRMVAGK